LSIFFETPHTTVILTYISLFFFVFHFLHHLNLHFTPTLGLNQTTPLSSSLFSFPKRTLIHLLKLDLTANRKTRRPTLPLSENTHFYHLWLSIILWFLVRVRPDLTVVHPYQWSFKIKRLAMIYPTILPFLLCQNFL
jgi:hypothetical protein